MDCPRCSGHLTVFELGGAVSRVCEDCAYVGIRADHRPDEGDIESWDDALTRFQTEFPESLPDAVARVDADTAPPDAPEDPDTTTGAGGFQFSGAPDSKTVADTGPEPGTDFPTAEPAADGLAGPDAKVVTRPDAETTPSAEPPPQADADPVDPDAPQATPADSRADPPATDADDAAADDREDDPPHPDAGAVDDSESDDGDSTAETDTA